MTASQLPILLFPHTLLRPSLLAGLLPWFEPLLFMQPAGFSLGARPSAFGEAGLVRALRPPAYEYSPDALDPRLGKLLGQWQAWVEQQKGSGSLEALKAKTSPPPVPETVRGLMKELRPLRQEVPADKPSWPEAPPGFFLHLAHLKDQQAAEMEALLGRMQKRQERMRQVLGLAGEDEPPVEYEHVLPAVMPPLDYRFSEEHLWAARLRAWAILAEKIEASGYFLATVSQPAAELLIERALRRLGPAGIEGRSPAGAGEVLPPTFSPPQPGSPQAQEAARLRLPDLSGLEPEDLLRLKDKLQQDGSLTPWRESLGGMLGRLSAEPWSAGLQAQMAAQAEELSKQAAAMTAENGRLAGAENKTLSLLAFPGLALPHLFTLMKDDQPQNPLPAEGGPQKIQPGSCPLLLVK